MKLQDGVPNPAITAAKPAAREHTRPQRRARRVPYRVPCRVRLVDPSTGEVRTVAGETLNLSRGGMSLQIPVDVAVGTWVETLVPHANGDPLFLCGTAVHSRRTMTANYEVGVETSRPATFT